MMFGYDEGVAVDWNRNDRIECNFFFALCFLQYKFNDGILENIPTYREAYHDVLEICVKLYADVLVDLLTFLQTVPDFKTFRNRTHYRTQMRF